MRSLIWAFAARISSEDTFSHRIHIYYRINSKYSERQSCANSVDQLRHRERLIRVYIVCLLSNSFPTHQQVVNLKPFQGISSDAVLLCLCVCGSICGVWLVITLQPLYNTVRYNTVLDITRFKDGSQKCIDYIEK